MSITIELVKYWEENIDTIIFKTEYIMTNILLEQLANANEKKKNRINYRLKSLNISHPQLASRLIKLSYKLHNQDETFFQNLKREYDLLKNITHIKDLSSNQFRDYRILEKKFYEAIKLYNK